MHKVFITVFINNEVYHSRKHSISSDNFSDNQFPETVTFFVPLSWQRFFFRSCSHIPFLPLLGVMNESSNNVGEVWQLLEIANCIPIRRFNPIVGIERLVLAINDFSTTSEKEVVLFLINLFESNSHHETKKKFVFLK